LEASCLLMISIMLLIVKKHLQRKRQVPIDHPSRILIQVCPSINLCRHGHARKMVEIGLRLQMSSEKD
jgi:hypothetical protein